MQKILSKLYRISPAISLLSLPVGYAVIRPTGLGLYAFLGGWYLLQRSCARGAMFRNSTGLKIALSGKVVMVTGGNTGLGYETCLELCRMGAHVILACRDLSKGRSAVQKIQSKVPNGKITLMQLDLASRRSIENFVQEYKQMSLPSLDILVNNAGVMMCPYETTAEGWETQFGTNHLGHYLLTHLLLPELLRSSAPRVVNVSSGANQSMTPTKEAPIDIEAYAKVAPGAYDSRYSYGVSKLCNAMHARELSRLNPTLTAVSLHPGVVLTELGRYFAFNMTHPWIGWVLQKTLLPLFLKYPNEGCQTTLHCCINEVKKGGYYADCAISSRVHPTLLDDARCADLTALSKRLLKL